MTCIISFFDKGNIVLAGDKSGSNGFTKHLIKEPKVFHNGDFMIGYTTSFRMGQILKYVWKPPERNINQNTENYIYSTVTTNIRKLFKDNGFGDDKKNEFGNFVICYENRIFEMQGDMSILEHELDIVCVGSGEYHATAAVQVLKDYETNIETILGKAYKIVSQDIASVSCDFDYITNKKGETK